MYIDGILAQDYGTPYSISFYSKNYNLNFGETINMSEEEKEAIRIKRHAILLDKEAYGTDSENFKTDEILLNYIDKLEKENEELKKNNSKLILGKFREVADKNSYIKDMYISIDEIKQLVGYEENEDVSKDDIISLIKLMWEEFNRLEDIEDFMATQCISKKKIREKIKELEEKDETSPTHIYGYGIKFLKELL